MKTLYKFALFFVFLLFVRDVFGQQVADFKELAGTYVYSSGFVGANYKLSADGNFEYTTFSDCCDPIWREKGSFSVKDELVRFKILKHTLNQYDLLNPKEKTEAMRKLYDYKGEDFKAEDIQTEYDFAIVRWGERVYLINPYQLHLFAAAVNLKIEPRARIIDENYLTSRFYLRAGDESKKVSGKPSFSKLLDEILPLMPVSPISATVAKIEEQGKEKVLIVDKGSKDGLLVGMCFVGKRLKPEYGNLLWVISVEENSAKLRDFRIYSAYDYRTGDVLSTESTYKSGK